MKHKVGDVVRIKSLEWYDDMRNGCDSFDIDDDIFVEDMSEYCGMQATIMRYFRDGAYLIDVDNEFWIWTDGMFEELT